MTEHVRIPALAYLTSPEEGVFYLNLKFSEPGITRGTGPFERVQVNRDQLAGLVVEGVRALLETKT